jgi:hypothetical protein
LIAQQVDVAAHEDNAAANEANAGDYLGRDASWIDDHLAAFQNVVKPYFETSMKRAAETPTRVLTLRPALFCRTRTSRQAR